jgi:hypothetical protein
MKDLNQLEKYYTEKFKSFYDPAFNQLSQHQIKTLENSLGFSLWKLKNSKWHLPGSFKKSLHLK